MRSAASGYWKNRQPPVVQSLQVSIVHYYANGPVGDTDNLVKPILDALQELLYKDDSLVSDVICRRRRIDTRYDFSQVPLILLDGLTSGADDFIYVVVEPAPDPTVLKP
ncbi:MAG: crossover junction endodeoxyribonuclease RusA [Chthoniobacter sp.]|nr:crossover junction endodeoxyribonuclease RusA [Chthoniobacter sp.]